MPVPTHEHIEELGPEVLPFERTKFNRDILKGEDILFNQHIYDATDNKLPPDVIIVDKESITKNPKKGRYLWVIDKDGLRIVLEAIKNPESERGIMCHTNITGGNRAFQGGELWFGEDKKVYINWFSGRYGYPTPDQWIAVVEYFKYVGYTKVEQLL